MVISNFSLCYEITSNSMYYPYQDVFSRNVNNNKIYQLTHMISVRNTNGSMILLSGNNFTNVSLSGTLLNFQDSISLYNTSYVITDNIFRYIHAQVSSNVISILRVYVDSMDPLQYAEVLNPYDYNDHHTYNALKT
jgi:hypothetical protein